MNVLFPNGQICSGRHKRYSALSYQDMWKVKSDYCDSEDINKNYSPTLHELAAVELAGYKGNPVKNLATLYDLFKHPTGKKPLK